MTRTKRYLRNLAWPALGLALLVNTGCLLAAAGAAGYVYYNAPLYRNYPANLADTTAAVRAALTDLHLPLDKETSKTASATLQSRTAKGDRITIDLELVSGPLPVDGSSTRVSVRVGFTGDDDVSGRILDQITAHLTRNVPVPPTTPAPAATTTTATPRPAETAPPPLAPPAPIPVKR